MILKNSYFKNTTFCDRTCGMWLYKHEYWGLDKRKSSSTGVMPGWTGIFPPGKGDGDGVPYGGKGKGI
ncbi:hypothetical protein RintRC_2073 [Richelia intracellularis]|nr:hypothetical protein RintRC_2073 [Richelia intracellularis]